MNAQSHSFDVNVADSILDVNPTFEMILQDLAVYHPLSHFYSTIIAYITLIASDFINITSFKTSCLEKAAPPFFSDGTCRSSVLGNARSRIGRAQLHGIPCVL